MKEEKLTTEERRNLSLVYSVRTMLRRNEAIKLRKLGLESDSVILRDKAACDSDDLVSIFLGEFDLVC